MAKEHDPFGDGGGHHAIDNSTACRASDKRWQGPLTALAVTSTRWVG